MRSTDTSDSKESPHSKQLQPEGSQWRGRDLGEEGGTSVKREGPRVGTSVKREGPRWRGRTTVKRERERGQVADIQIKIGIPPGRNQIAISLGWILYVLTVQIGISISSWGNQHNNGPHQDLIFDNYSQLGIVGAGWGGGGGGLMHNRLFMKAVRLCFSPSGLLSIRSSRSRYNASAINYLNFLHFNLKCMSLYVRVQIKIQ